MADNPSTGVPIQQDGDSKIKGSVGSTSPHANSRHRQGGSQRGGRGRGRGQNRGGGRGRSFGSKNEAGRHKKGEVGRVEYGRNKLDRRKRNDEEQEAKRRKIEDGDEDTVSSHPFSKEEIEGESRKPKRKVAVMIGYAGSGYKGMQINGAEKTIEGDIFKAFVAAGAISKANADDPKKSSLVRCARTDKGVHAAGNVISLKLIVEEPGIVQKINENLPPQIRVWGFERTNGSFSCYQTCDSRWYEYLIPTYSFLPPHPQSFLGKKLVDSAEKEGIFETYQSLQEDVASFWSTVEEEYIKPILDELEPGVKDAVLKTIHGFEEENEEQKAANRSQSQDNTESTSDASKVMNSTVEREGEIVVHTEGVGVSLGERETLVPGSPAVGASQVDLADPEVSVKKIKAAYIEAKKAYRISASRRQRLQDALNCYVGTQNFHNYTIQKSFSDPSAKRVIRSFKVGADPVIIHDTEWLSLKVHGQSFMMHQIRKMVAMAALVVRCGSPLNVIRESYGKGKISIPKAPGLGLLLERPVFDSYNERASREFSREKIDFNKYEQEMLKFKQNEIYDRIFREEDRDHQFHTFFHHLDHYRTDYFLWVTASGISAISKALVHVDDGSDDEIPDVKGEEG